MRGLLNAAETAGRLPFSALVDELRTVVCALENGMIACPERQVIPMHGGARLLSMAAVAHDIAVHKLITVAPANPQQGLPTILGQLSVIDARTGVPLLTLDGATVTGRRTAALSILGIQALLGRDPRHILLVGTGTQASHHAHALADLYPDTPVHVAGRTRAAAERFCQQHPRSLLLRALGSVPEMDRSVDVVITCTTSPTPVYEHAAAAGRLIIAVGVFTPAAAEIAAGTVAASGLYVDDLAGASHEAGDLILAGVDWGAVQSLARAIATPPGPDARPLLLKTVGCAAWDLAAARVALRWGDRPSFAT